MSHMYARTHTPTLAYVCGEQRITKMVNEHQPTERHKYTFANTLNCYKMVLSHFHFHQILIIIIFVLYIINNNTYVINVIWCTIDTHTHTTLHFNNSNIHPSLFMSNSYVCVVR